MVKTTKDASGKQPLRLWPGILLALLILIVKLLIPKIVPDALPLTMLGGPVLGLLIIIWWAFLSRAPGLERWSAILVMALVLVGAQPLLHDSIARAGQGFLYPILALPWICFAFVLAVSLTHKLSNRIRRSLMAVTIILSCGFWTLIRTGGINNDGVSDFFWRWKYSPEQQLLTSENKRDSGHAVLPESKPEWPGFRGTSRDGIVRNVKIKTDWKTSPPKMLWRKPVGPGWSSFAVHGHVFYTQEQRGEEEVVSCYHMLTGDMIWRYSDSTRFWESNGGAGPRATPTLYDNRVYTLGGTGIFNVLNAADGSLIWSRNAAKDADTNTPIWGFSGSPLITDSRVILSLAGSLIAYDLSGNIKWTRFAGGDCYSSPHEVTIEKTPQVLLQNESGILSVSPSDGTLLWEYAWAGHPIVQPAHITGGELLVSVDDKNGIRRLTVSKKPEGWSVTDRWTSNKIKPYFNDSAIHNGCLYGFDGPFLACINLQNGKKRWRGGRYGRGQFILLADQDILLVLSEKGDLALVDATPEKFTELARIPAIKGKTWNHPVLVGNILLVRNAQEMAAFRLTES